MEHVARFLNGLPDAYQQLVKSVFDDMGQEGSEALMKKLKARVDELAEKIDRRRKRATDFEAQIRDTDAVLSKLDEFRSTNGSRDDLGLLLLNEVLRDRAERLRSLIEKIDINSLVQKKRELEDTTSRLRNRLKIAESLTLMFKG